MKILMLLLIPALVAQGATYTSVQSGNWNSAGTWDLGAVPGPGDIVRLANGFTVTIPAGYTAIPGASPAADDTATPAVACTSNTGTGVLDIQGTLLYRGTVTQCNSIWRVSAGARLIHDSSQSTTPSAANYTWRIGMVNAQYGSRLVAAGTAGGRITIGIAGAVNPDGSGLTVCAPGGICASGQSGGFQGGPSAGSDYGSLQCYYCDISNFGTSSGYLLRAIPTNGSNVETRGVVLENTTIQHCGVINLPNSNGSNTYFRLHRVAIIDPLRDVNGRSIAYGNSGGMSASVTGGDRRIEDCYIEGEVYIGTSTTGYPNGGWIIRNSLLRGWTGSNDPPLAGLSRLTVSDGNFDLVWLENRLLSSSDSGNSPAGTLRRLIMTRNYQTGGGPHFVFGVAGNTVIDGWYAECDCNANNAGDVWQILPNAATAPFTYTVKNGVAAASNNGTAIGIVINVSGSTNCNGSTTFCPQTAFTRNTLALANSDSTGVGCEGNSGYAGEYSSVDSNIVFVTTPGPALLTVWGFGQTPAAGMYTYADCNHTWGITGSLYKGIDTNPGAYSSIPGGHDTSGDPAFTEQRKIVDFGRRWDPSIAAISDVGDKMRQVYLDMAQGTNLGDHRFTILNLYNWLRAGWRPRNKATWTAGLDGAHVGGVAPERAFGRTALGGF